MSFVIDASVALRWLIIDEQHSHADAVLARTVREPELFAVPELFAFEVFSVICRIHPDPQKAFMQGISPILSSGVLRYPMTDALAQRAFRMVSLGLTGYDATYAALAEELEGTWLTFDTAAHAKLADEAVSLDLNGTLPDGF